MITPSNILARLDAQAVLIPIRKGSKASAVRGWSRLKFKSTQALTFQKRLTAAPAIAVCLGSQSEGVCSIDFDNDSALAEFMALNPSLQNSLTTAGKRGCNIWLKVTGDMPRTKVLKRGDEPLGEWRSTGGYTIICGLHPEGSAYRVLVNLPPISLAFDEIIWPEEWTTPEVVPLSPSPPLSQSSEYSLPSKVSKASLYHAPQSLIERDRQAQEARKKLAQNSALSRFYERYVTRSFTPKQGSRNGSLVAMVTFLFHTVGRTRLIELVTAFHQINYDIFLDPLTQHMNEATSHLEALEADFLTKLSPNELAIVQQLPSQHLEAFRICRDLAHAERAESPAGEFFISFNELADRLTTSPSQAGRVIEALISLEAFEVITKGQRYQKGRKSSATRYRWLVD
ncbi:bifunctional DNA primase/polymerase [Akkermansiaceae bacterium]|nr:bifunctional DNA primase/polymerase [Akkermansiaceae bacterium]MDB4323703.1 bifunctional DNA primase/polymerase [Akkermansiaceae bacterium]